MWVILILIGILIFLSRKEKFASRDIKEKIKNHIDCERNLQLPKGERFGKTKCFSCEDQIVNSLGDDYISLAQPEKCFSCEDQIISQKIQSNK